MADEDAKIDGPPEGGYEVAPTRNNPSRGEGTGDDPDGGIDPDMFAAAREYTAESAEQLDVVEIVQHLEGTLENDPAKRTHASAKALGYVAELRDRLEADA